MAKSQTERINELDQLTATLAERLDGVRRNLDTLNTRCQKADDVVNGVVTRIAVVETHVTELKKTSEEWGRRRWALVPSLIGAILGGAISLLGSYVIRKYFP